MPNVLIRNVAEDDLHLFKRIARQKGETLQSQLQKTLTERARELRKEDGFAEARRIRELADPSKLPDNFWERLREERDARP